jgi:hypothetical protein
MFPSSRYPSIHPSIIRNSNATSAARSPHASVRSGHRSLATFRYASYGSVLPNHMALGTRRYPSPPPHPSRSAFLSLRWSRADVLGLPAPTGPASSGHLIVPILEPQSPEAKMWHETGSVDRALFSSNPYIGSHRIRGKKMAAIPMIPVGRVTTLNRSILLLTEGGISGDGGDDFICGHCGSIILEDFDPSTVKGNPVYQCGFCENNNDLPFTPSDGRHWSSR